MSRRADLRIGVDAPVAQKRPVGALRFNLGQIDLHHENLLPLGTRPSEHFPRGGAHETLPPELDAGAAVRFLDADAIGHGDVAAVRNGVAALDGFPRVVLLLAEFLFFRGMPADRGGIKKNLRAVQRREPRRLRIPLVPANAARRSSRSGFATRESRGRRA